MKELNKSSRPLTFYDVKIYIKRFNFIKDILVLVNKFDLNINFGTYIYNYIGGNETRVSDISSITFSFTKGLIDFSEVYSYIIDMPSYSNDKLSIEDVLTYNILNSTFVIEFNNRKRRIILREVVPVSLSVSVTNDNYIYLSGTFNANSISY